jgi:hypothetical protein
MPEFMGVLSGFVAAFFLFKLFFGSKEDFFECLRFWLIPDIVSLFRGEFMDDRWGEFKLFIWLGLSGFVGYYVFRFFS